MGIYNSCDPRRMGFDQSAADIINGILCELSLNDLGMAVSDERFVPKRILRCGPATIVFWQDGTKTVVKRAEDEPDNEYTAFTAALAIKIFKSNSALKKMVKTLTEVQK